MELNKTDCLTIGQALVPNLTINNNKILNFILYKDLGINFDNSLYFKNHIGMCCTGAYNVITRIFRCFITNNKIAIIKAYITYAIPHVEFWN